MKKGMLVMAIVVALSFPVSMIAVSPLFAAQAPKTTPTTKQQGATQEGSPQQAPTQKTPPQFSKNKEMVHTKFWTFEIKRCLMNGTNVFDYSTSNNPLDVNLGPLTIKCYYTVKTPPIDEITEADATAWGRGVGKSYHNRALLEHQTPSSSTCGLIKEDAKPTPIFTWSDVQRWKKSRSGGGNIVHMWGETMDFTWNPSPCVRGLTKFSFEIDIYHYVTPDITFRKGWVDVH